MTALLALLAVFTGAAIGALMAAPLVGAYLLLARQATRKPFELGTCAAHRADEDERTIRMPTNLFGGAQ